MKHEDSLLSVFDSPERGEAERYAMANLPRDLGEEIIAEILDTPTPDDEELHKSAEKIMNRYDRAFANLAKGKTDSDTLRLSETESRILRDLGYARMKTLRAGEIQAPDSLPLVTELNRSLARQCLTVLDFYRAAMDGDEASIRKQAEEQRRLGPHAGCVYHDCMIDEYQTTLNQLNPADGPEEILRLQNKLKEFGGAIKR